MITHLMHTLLLLIGCWMATGPAMAGALTATIIVNHARQHTHHDLLGGGACWMLFAVFWIPLAMLAARWAFNL